MNYHPSRVSDEPMLGCAPNLETNKEIELDFIVRSLEATAAREIEEKAFELVGREPDEAEADLDQACRALAHEIVRQHGTSAADACLLVEGLGRAIIARASRMTYAAGINLRTHLQRALPCSSLRRAFSASHVDRDTQADVELAAEVVLKAAIGFIGNPANPLDWPELAASTVEKKGNDLILLEAGETKASIGKIVGRHWAEIESDNAKAAYAEFGTAKVPSRPFFAPAAAEGASALVLRSHQRVARAFRRTWSRRQR